MRRARKLDIRYSDRMLGFFIPLCRNDYKGWRDCALTSPKYESNSSKATKVVRGREAAGNDAPDDALETHAHVSLVHTRERSIADGQQSRADFSWRQNLHHVTNEFGDGQAAHQVDEQVLRGQLSKIENADRP